MRVLIINPNSDPDMTAAIQRSAEDFARGEFDVVVAATTGSPQFIETYQDQIRAAPGMMQLVREYEDNVDAIVIACHSDPNLDAVKEATTRPVVGIGEASMKIASMLGHSFSVVTTHQHSIPGKIAQARRYHLQELMASVRAPDKGEQGLGNEALFEALSKVALAEDHAEVIVLGCAGLAGMDKALQQSLGVPVLDGVACALIVATGLVRYGTSTSKAQGYNPDFEADQP
jgi:allantoin racemase